MLILACLPCKYLNTCEQIKTDIEVLFAFIYLLFYGFFLIQSTGKYEIYHFDTICYDFLMFVF